MAKLLKLRRGTTLQHGSFTGAEGEVTVDTDKDTLVVHDGSTAAGHPVAAEDMANVSSASIVGRLGTGSIVKAKLEADAIDGTKLADNAVDSEHYTDGSIDHEHLAADCIDGDNIQDDVINSEHIAAGAIDLEHMSSESVDEDNLHISNAGSNGQFLQKQSGNTGGLTWASVATTAADVTITANNSTDETVYPVFVDGATGAQELESDTGLTYNPSTGLLTAVGLTLSGNLTVNGTTTTVATTNTTVTDNLIELNSGAGSNANDCGILIERGSTGNNAIIAWDESADKFTVGTTTATNSDTGDLTITTGTLVANIEGNVTGSSTSCSGNAAGLTGSPNITVGTIGCGNITGTGTISDTKGDVRRAIQSIKSAAYSLVATDAGKHIFQSGSNGHITIGVPGWTAGDMVTIVNGSGGNINIIDGSGLTLYNAADGATGDRVLANRGVATLLMTDAGTAYISGSGIS